MCVLQTQFGSSLYRTVSPETKFLCVLELALYVDKAGLSEAHLSLPGGIKGMHQHRLAANVMF